MNRKHMQPVDKNALHTLKNRHANSNTHTDFKPPYAAFLAQLLCTLLTSANAFLLAFWFTGKGHYQSLTMTKKKSTKR
jgi:hypothetical protein